MEVKVVSSGLYWVSVPEISSMDREKHPRTLEQAVLCVTTGEWSRNDIAWAKFLGVGAVNSYQDVIKFLVFFLLKRERINDKTAYK